MTAKKTTAKKAKKKTTPKTKSNGNGEGYKGHRPGSIKEQLHQLFDRHGAEKARPLALKLGAAAGTINTSFSQFRSGSRAKA
ncbi:hypothetical protein [Bradyrhizobium sp. URHC0002]